MLKLQFNQWINWHYLSNKTISLNFTYIFEINIEYFSHVRWHFSHKGVETPILSTVGYNDGPEWQWGKYLQPRCWVFLKYCNIYSIIRKAKSLYPLLRKLCKRRIIRFSSVKVNIAKECRKLNKLKTKLMNYSRILTTGRPLVYFKWLVKLQK